MADFIIALPVLVILLVAGISAAVQYFSSQKNSAAPLVRRSRDGYNREVDAIHITSDAAGERQRRLDQLKSLYEAGMMEKEEYGERREAIEADFRSQNRT